jgi:hypothetical protein
MNITTIYFSKDRPLQLELAIRSNKICCHEWDKLENNHVIFKASDERFKNSYKQLAEEYPSVNFVEERDFKQDLIDIVSENKKYILFVVDATIFTKEYSIKDILAQLDLFRGILGFSLRLGENTKNCYPLAIENEMPKMDDFGPNMKLFNWTHVDAGDFGYPLEVSSSIYRTFDLKPLIENAKYSNPNYLEWAMSQSTKQYKNFPYLSCYETSVAFSNPINKIQNTNNNRAGGKAEYSIDSLLEKFEQEYRIEYFDNLLHYISNGCHQEVDIEFIERKYI